MVGFFVIFTMIKKYRKVVYALLLFFHLLMPYVSYGDDFMPEGFGDLSTEEESDVKVYYSGKYLGMTEAVFDDDFVDLAGER